MASGLIALLDDVAAIAKIAAASLDDAAAQAAKAGSKAAGIVIDDAAVTPRYVVGFAADRELPIIRKIAMGSLKNKLLFLTPGALLLSVFAPWIITPLLMAGGAYLCLEGYHKVLDIIRPHEAHEDPIAEAENPQTPQEMEDEKVDSAIRTDFILSAEIMAITLASVASSPLWLEAVILIVVGIAMTVLVYGAVALIVKADDVGAAMARQKNALSQSIGRGLVVGMPGFLKVLSYIGMVAMLWVGGGILTHGLHELGVHGPEDWIKGVAKAAAGGLPSLGGFVTWLVSASIAAVIGLVVGAIVDPLARRVITPLARAMKGMFAKKAA
jgi:uncharacterized protein